MPDSVSLRRCPGKKAFFEAILTQVANRGVDFSVPAAVEYDVNALQSVPCLIGIFALIVRAVPFLYSRITNHGITFLLLFE
jgi:hypothetical protein